MIRLRLLSLLVPALLLVSMPFLFAVEADPMLKFQLKDNEIQKLTVVKESHIYGKGKEMTEIYDGGVDQYVKAGVVEASQQYYTQGKTNAEMVVLRLSSMKQAQAFYDYWRKTLSDTGKAEPVHFPKFAGACNGVVVRQTGAVYGYTCTKDYLITITLDSDQPKLASTMMIDCAKKIWK